MSTTPESEAKAVSRSLVANPYYAVNLHPRLVEPHEPSVTEAQWIEANRKLLTKIGDEAYLRLLLDVLKGADIATRNEKELADIFEMYSGLLGGTG